MTDRQAKGAWSGASAGLPPGGAARYTPPLLNQRIFAPYKIAAAVEVVASGGIQAAAILARTGLSFEQIHDPHTLTSVRQYLTVCDNIIAITGPRASLEIAFAIGARLHLSAYGMYGYALMCSPTMREFFDFAVRYHPLATPTLRLGWRLEGDVAVWECHEIYSNIMGPELRNFLVRQQMKQLFTHMGSVVGGDGTPIRALFALPEPESAEVDARQLSCECLFAQSAHELHYPARILELAPELGNRLTRIVLEETCDRLIGQSKMKSGVAGQVYQMIMLAPERFPPMHAIAAQLGMTERTLRRRLDEEHISYRDIIDDIRRMLALEYLHTTHMSVEDIAWNIGFTDSANLRRAIRRWTGQTISMIRAESAR